jgi:hypothetical protein
MDTSIHVKILTKKKLEDMTEEDFDILRLKTKRKLKRAERISEIKKFIKLLFNV